MVKIKSHDLRIKKKDELMKLLDEQKNELASLKGLYYNLKSRSEM
jgi:ribosomal protein L29